MVGWGPVLVRRVCRAGRGRIPDRPHSQCRVRSSVVTGELCRDHFEGSCYRLGLSQPLRYHCGG